MLPAIVYMHGGGWILGNAGAHNRLVRELAVGAPTCRDHGDGFRVINLRCVGS
jgi:hypothetical protein